jgi:LemA protein
VQTNTILERLYGVRPQRYRRSGVIVVLRRARYRAINWVLRHSLKMIVAATLIATWAWSHIYYYNYLIDLEFNAQAAWAQIEATSEKRNHIQRDLRQLLLYYANYESRLMTGVVELRNGRTRRKLRADEVPPEPSLGEMLGRIDALAEQYPNLHLTSTVERFSQAVVASEAEVALRIMEYNNSVNMYTTALNTYPGKVFGKTLGFESMDFYQPKDRSVLEYRELELQP